MKNTIPRRFFDCPTLEVARNLLGCMLTTWVNNVETSGMIVEVEAYRGDIDPAAHSYCRPTPRTEVMFGVPGRAYVYFIYGMHYCVNVVTEEQGCGAAVLVRAIKPLVGVEIMLKRRGIRNIKQLTNGPAKLCRALAIDKKMLGQDLLKSRLIRLERFREFGDEEIRTSRRVGISKAQELEWRFYVKDNVWVSRPKS